MDPSLRDIELALSMLWTNRGHRESFLAGSAPDAIHPALIKHIDVRGVRLYASLIELGRLDLMASIYPYCKKVLGKHFNGLVHDYMETVPPGHFNLNQAAGKFSQFLDEHAEAHLARHPFLAELADYEWIELAAMESNCEIPATDGEDSSLNSPDSLESDLQAFAATVPRLNPTLIARAYKYPVDQIAAKLADDEKLPRRQKAQPCWILVVRSSEHETRYVDVGELAYILVQALIANPQITYGELIAMACNQSGSTDVEGTVADFLSMVEEFKSTAVFIG